MFEKASENVRRAKLPGETVRHDKTCFLIEGNGSKELDMTNFAGKTSTFRAVLKKSFKVAEELLPPFDLFPLLPLQFDRPQRKPWDLGRIVHSGGSGERFEKKGFFVRQNRSFSRTAQAQDVFRLIRRRVPVERLQTGEGNPAFFSDVSRWFLQDQTSAWRHER